MSKKYQKLWGLPEPDCQAADYVPPPLPQSQGHVYQTDGLVQNEKKGPGTELKHVMKSIGVNTFHGCECESRVGQMNKWGVEGCKAQRDEIVQWLRDSAAKRSWAEKIKAAAMAIATGLAFQLDLTDPYGSLVDLAIRRDGLKDKKDGRDAKT